jgi:hypothetical protein
VCGLGSIERGTGANSACSEGMYFEVFACLEIGRRPESIGVEISKYMPRGHPELSLECLDRPMHACNHPFSSWLLRFSGR